ncbi:B12-binding domain-containing radical SAM protein [Candidatus Omnitrophota bacterium]
MKILFINPYPDYAQGVEGTKYPPLGLLYIAAFLKQNGYSDIKVIDANLLRLENSQLIKKIKDYNPDVVGISANIVTHRVALDLARSIKNQIEGVKIMAGGAFPSIFPEKYLDHVDLIVDGEGESVVLDIVQRFEKNDSIEDVDGIIFKQGEKVIRNPRPALNEDIDSLPFPAYDLLEPEISEYSKGSRVVRRFMAPILTSRGCPYQCTYCNKSVFGSKFRARSPENILKEIDWIHDNFSVNQIDILDDNFNLIPDRAIDVMDRIIQKGYKLAINCHNGLRADKLDEVLVDRLKRAGVFKVGLGIESADEDILKSIKKSLDLSSVEKAVSLLRRAGIIVHGYFILGLPGDSPATMQKTIDFAKRLNPHFLNPATCIPFPGTEAYEMVKEKGKFLVDVDNGVDSGFFEGKVFFEYGPTREADVSTHFKKVFREFYGRPYKVYDIITHLRSVDDFKWVASMGMSVVSNMLRKKSNGKKKAYK